MKKACNEPCQTKKHASLDNKKISAVPEHKLLLNLEDFYLWETIEKQLIRITIDFHSVIFQKLDSSSSGDLLVFNTRHFLADVLLLFHIPILI